MSHLTTLPIDFLIPDQALLDLSITLQQLILIQYWPTGTELGKRDRQQSSEDEMKKRKVIKGAKNR